MTNKPEKGTEWEKGHQMNPSFNEEATASIKKLTENPNQGNHYALPKNPTLPKDLDTHGMESIHENPNA